LKSFLGSPDHHRLFCWGILWYDEAMNEETQEPKRPQKTAGPSDQPQGASSDFNPEALQSEFRELVEKKFGGKVQVVSMDESMDFGPNFSTASCESQESENGFLNIAEFDYKPRDLKEYLDRFVVGQDEAKKALAIAVCDHYNHLQAAIKQDETKSNPNYQKQNVMIMGPTGVGKTYLVKLISELIGVPFVKADATRFSEVGYMGANVDDIVRDLVQVAGGNQELASKGIVYVDEVDKLASRRDHTGRDVSGRGVQFGFLRLLENSDVDLNASHDIASQFKTFMNFQKKGKADKEVVNTRDILFIFSGAFHGLEDIVNRRLNQQPIGLHRKSEKLDMPEALKKVEVKDLVEFGFEHEFVGRLPIRVACDSLTVEDLHHILTHSEHSIVKQYQASFAHYGIRLRFTEGALRALSQRAHTQQTGARALLAVFEELLRPFKFELPSSQVKELVVDEAIINNPMGALHHIIN
jgi:endopeptidase Clp ATP-binding regulatory subunit ClpX